MPKETVYVHDSLTAQTLRVVHKVSPTRIDFLISDARTDGTIHDHSGVNLAHGEAFNVYRGQQKK